MFNYRITALLMPVFLLLFLPALAAYSWQLPLGNKLALPFLTLLTILFCALRYPGLLASPLVFASGLCCDLFTRSPLGFWTFLFLTALACARATTVIVERTGPLMGYVCFALSILFLAAMTWGLSSLYQLQWQDPLETANGMIMALVLLLVPVLFLIGLEKLLILKKERHRSRFSRTPGL